MLSTDTGGASPAREEALIAGAGPIGLACAISARRHGLDPLVIDAGAVCHAIVRYPVGMLFFTTPERLEIGDHPLACSGPKPTREEALKYYRGVARTERLRLRTYTRLAGAERADGGLLCRLETRHGAERVLARKLVLATGYFDRPRRLGVPGEDLPHVSHYFDEAHRGFGLDVAVIGGRNSAAEAALELFRAGARVTLIHRGEGLGASVKYWVRPDLENRITAGEIQARFGANVVEIGQREVRVRDRSGKEASIPAERVYALTGFEPDFAFFRRLGIELDGETGVPRLDPETFETNVPGLHMAGSITRGKRLGDVFIENGRFDGERIFGDERSRERVQVLYGAIHRPSGE